jgi:hypothetical protein
MHCFCHLSQEAAHNRHIRRYYSTGYNYCKLNTEYKVQNSKYRIQKTEYAEYGIQKLMYIELPMDL